MVKSSVQSNRRTDLAGYMINCVEDESKWNKVLDLGGPDDGMTMKQQGEMIFS